MFPPSADVSGRVGRLRFAIAFPMMCPIAIAALSTVVLAQGAGPAASWYVPVEADFRPEYDGDAANRRAETWDEYWGWVRQFYDGNFFSDGWTKQAKATIVPIKAKGVRAGLTETFNDLGKKLAKEWSKDNGVRKISTADLSRWGKALRAAQRKEDGSGKSLRAALRAIESEADKQLAK